MKASCKIPTALSVVGPPASRTGFGSNLELLTLADTSEMIYGGTTAKKIPSEWSPEDHFWDHHWEQTSKNHLVTPREISHKNGTKVQRILFLSWWKPSTITLGWNPGIGPMEIHLRVIWDLPRNKECCANPRDHQQDPQDIPSSQFLDPNAWMGTAPFLMIYITCTESQIPLKAPKAIAGTPLFLQDKPESFIELKKGEGWFNPSWFSPFTPWSPKFPMHSSASAAGNELRVEDFQGAWILLEK